MFSKSAAFYDAVYRFKDYEAEATRVHSIVSQHTRGDSLLDVACGTGAHLQYLRQWYRVEGIDINLQLLDLARHRLPDVSVSQGNMEAFDLGRTFDAVVCLFSSVGYTRTVAGLRRAIERMANHVAPDGVLLVEPFLGPDEFLDGHVAALFVDEPQLKIARMHVSKVRGRLSIFDFQYLVATSNGMEHFAEHHELGLFTRDDYEQAFAAAGLDVEHDADGLMGRGLYVGTRPRAASRS
jgi:SAM-dependent methyltransferase